MRAQTFPATIAASVPETWQLQSLTVEVPDSVLRSYRIPGQFVWVEKEEGGEGAFYALANAPAGEQLQLLIKKGDPLSDQLASLPKGGRLHLSEAMGHGFPVQGEGQDLLLFATGSGIAPIRAFLQWVAREREAFGRIHLFYGVRTRWDFPYRRERHEMQEAGVELHPVISSLPPGGGHARYVQERFRAVLPEVEGAVALLCGLEGMVEGVREALLEAGMPAERILLNL